MTDACETTNLLLLVHLVGHWSDWHGGLVVEEMRVLMLVLVEVEEGRRKRRTGVVRSACDVISRAAAPRLESVSTERDKKRRQRERG